VGRPRNVSSVTPIESPLHVPGESPLHVLKLIGSFTLSADAATYKCGHKIIYTVHCSIRPPGTGITISDGVHGWHCTLDGGGNATAVGYYAEGIGTIDVVAFDPIDIVGSNHLSITITAVPLLLHSADLYAFLVSLRPIYGPPDPPPTDGLLAPYGYGFDQWNSASIHSPPNFMYLPVQGSALPAPYPDWISERYRMHGYAAGGGVDIMWSKDNDASGTLSPVGAYTLITDPTGLAPASIHVTE